MFARISLSAVCLFFTCFTAFAGPTIETQIPAHLDWVAGKSPLFARLEQEPQVYTGVNRQSGRPVVIADYGFSDIYVYDPITKREIPLTFSIAEDEPNMSRTYFFDLDSGNILKVVCMPYEDCSSEDGDPTVLDRAIFAKVDLQKNLSSLDDSVLPYIARFQQLLDEGEMSAEQLYKMKLVPAVVQSHPRFGQNVLLVFNRSNPQENPIVMNAVTLQILPRSKFARLVSRCFSLLGVEPRPVIFRIIADNSAFALR